jgi:hypothetical protein
MVVVPTPRILREVVVIVVIIFAIVPLLGKPKQQCSYKEETGKHYHVKIQAHAPHDN